MENDVYVVVKTLYAMDCSLVDDFGNHVNCISELVDVFANEQDARETQESILNLSEFDIVPCDDEFDPDAVYIDVTIETTKVR